MYQVILLSCMSLVSLATCRPDPGLTSYWEEYKTYHNKQYGDNEESWRRSVWEHNVELITSHNLDVDLGRHSYRLGLNAYADLPREEFLKLMTKPYRVNPLSRGYKPTRGQELPDHVDWRTKGWVTPVRNQGAMTPAAVLQVTDAVTAQHVNATGTMVNLSTQNLIDCVPGFAGPDEMYEYIIKNKGIDTEACYPSAAKGPCRFNRSCVGATISSYEDIPSGDEHALAVAVASVGPVVAGIDASHASFQLYTSGIYDERNCSSTNIDHVVLIVGYGTQDGQDYWIVKNSWGVNWGMKGYILMSRNKKNQCGIASYASVPWV